MTASFSTVLSICVINAAQPAQAQGDSIGTCSFTRDCEGYEYCQTIQDAGCVCNFGQCVITGNPFFRGSECDQYEDFACKNDPANCFCQDGLCKEVRWECHETKDCSKLKKCDAVNCTCSGNLCEFDCEEDTDCEDFHCNTALGYKCKCENNLCAYKQKEKECKSISDCIAKGQCQADRPCACTQDYCTLPWWVQEIDQLTNCRSDQDCEETMFDCQGGKCSCLDKTPVNDWEMRGTCGQKEEVGNIGKKENTGNTKEDESNHKEIKFESKDMDTNDKIEELEDSLPKYNDKKSDQASLINTKPNDDKIVFPKDKTTQPDDEEKFSINKFGY